jgi:hypothetical protein
MVLPRLDTASLFLLRLDLEAETATVAIDLFDMLDEGVAAPEGCDRESRLVPPVFSLAPLLLVAIDLRE